MRSVSIARAMARRDSESSFSGEAVFQVMRTCASCGQSVGRTSVSAIPSTETVSGAAGGVTAQSRNDRLCRPWLLIEEAGCDRRDSSVASTTAPAWIANGPDLVVTRSKPEEYDP